MEKRRFILWFPILIGIIIIFNCDEPQPVDPGDPLLGELINFGDGLTTEFQVSTGTQDIDNGGLSVNPVGQYRGYIGKNLIQFTSFSVLSEVESADIVSARIIFPFSRTLEETGEVSNFTVHEYNEDWSEASELDSLEFLAFNASAMDTARYPADIDSLESTAILSFDIDTSLVKTWIALDEDNENNSGVLLQGDGESVFLFGNTRTSELIPQLEINTADTSYTIESGLIDYGLITGKPAVSAPVGSVVLRKASEERVALRWSTFLDTLTSRKIFVHSAEMRIPLDAASSYDAGRNHLLIIGESSEETGQEFFTIRADTLTIAAGDTVLFVQSGDEQSLLRNYLQRYVNSDTLSSGIILLYQQAGAGLQHLTLQPQEARLKIVYSEVVE